MEKVVQSDCPPCPFCGRYPHLWKEDKDFFVGCSSAGCYVRVKATSRRKSGAISEWNKYAVKVARKIDRLSAEKGAPAAILAVATEVRAMAK